MKKQWLIIIGILVAAALLFRFVLPLFTHKTSSRPTVAQQKKTYTDKANNFTMQVPKNWTTQESTAKNTTGLKTGYPIKQDVEISQLNLPGQMGVTVQVYKGQPTCPLAKKPTITLAGLPASYDALTHVYTIPTTTATILVSVIYPGSAGLHSVIKDTNTVRSPQPSTSSTGKQTLDDVLKTLKFNDFKPLSC